MRLFGIFNHSTGEFVRFAFGDRMAPMSEPGFLVWLDREKAERAAPQVSAYFKQQRYSADLEVRPFTIADPLPDISMPPMPESDEE